MTAKIIYRFMRGTAFIGMLRIIVTKFILMISSNTRSMNVSTRESHFFQNVDISKVLQDLNDNGVNVDLMLPDHGVQAIYDFAVQNVCYAFRDKNLGFKLENKFEAEKKLGKPILLAQYFNTTKELHIVNKLVTDPVINLIAQKYLGTMPVFMGTNLWWTFPVNASDEDKAKHAHVYHRDVDDYKFIKFFFYITDVDIKSGPHVYVRTSHKNIKSKRLYDRLRNRRYADSEIEELYGKENIQVLTGRKGSVIIEDTFGYHKGITPEDKPRLIFQIQFGLFDYGRQKDDAVNLKTI